MRTRLTPSEKAEQKQREKDEAVRLQHARRVAEFRDEFIRDSRRPVWTRNSCFDLAKDDPKHAGAWALYSAVEDFNRLSSSLAVELQRLQRDTAESITRVGAGQSSFYSSNGLCARYYEVDKYGHQVDALRPVIARTAAALGWRVREFEMTSEREHGDLAARLDVLKLESGNGYVVRRHEGDGVYAILNAGMFVTDGVWTYFETEDLAWEALHVVVFGQTL